MATKPVAILLVEDNPDDCFIMDQFIRDRHLPYRLTAVHSLSEARHKLKESPWELLLLDYQLPDGACFDLLPEVRDMPVVIISGAGDENTVVQAMRMGAYDYIIKSQDDSHLALFPSIIENVLKRKQTEDDLARSEHRYKTIVETVPDIIFQLDIDKKIIFVNSAIRTLGYEPAEIIGRPIQEFLCLQDDKELLQIATKRVGGRATKGLEICFRSRKGSFQWREVQVAMVSFDAFGLWGQEERGAKKDEKQFMGTQCVAWDITERKKNEMVLRQNEKKIHSILSNAMDGIISIDRNGIIEIFNPAAERIFGYKREELAGKSVNLLMPEPDRSKHDGYIQQYLSTGQAKILGRAREVMAVRKNGEEFPIELSTSEMSGVERWEDDMKMSFPKTAGGAGGGAFIGIVRDITERKRIENELRKYREDLEALIVERTAKLKTMHDQLLHAEKLNAVGKLSASIAHEINNPIFGIRNVLEQIGEEVELDEVYKRLLDMAVRECNRIADLTRKLHDFYAPTASIVSEVNLHTLIDDILLLLKKSFQVKKIVLEKKYCTNLPIIKAVQDQIKQVMLNLVQNAEEAIPESATDGKVSIVTAIDGGHIKIIIHDNGTGVLPEHKQFLFDPFFSTKPAVKGTGLGLSVCYGIIKEHGGSIDFVSDPGNTVFTVTLPIHTGK